jgi:hypothetical protein
MMRGEQKFLNALERFDANQRRFASDVTEQIKDNVINRVQQNDAIDTRHFIEAIDFRSVSSDTDYRHLIDASRDARVYYDGYVEFGRQKFSPFPGRPSYEEGIQATNISPIADDLMEASFRI